MEILWRGSTWIDPGHVFTTSRATLLDAATVTRSFQRAFKLAGVTQPRRFLLAQGFTLEDVKNLLGHSSIVLTSNTYGHVLEQRQQEVAGRSMLLADCYVTQPPPRTPARSSSKDCTQECSSPSTAVRRARLGPRRPAELTRHAPSRTWHRNWSP